MQALLRIVAAVLVFASTAGPASAAEVVRWDRIEGTTVMPDGSGMTVGPLQGSARSRVGGGGRAILYLDSGLVYVRIEGLSWALHYQNGPLGAGLSAQFVATVVCDSTERFGAAVWADTSAFQMTQGAATYLGVLALPQACRDRPDEIVFLVRHVNMPNPSLEGTFVAYGAGRVIH
jgi:hypothetical protein